MVDIVVGGNAKNLLGDSGSRSSSYDGFCPESDGPSCDELV